MKKILMVSSLLVLPLSFSYADNHMNQKSSGTHSTMRSHSTSMVHDANYLDSYSAHHRDGIAMAEMAATRAENPELKKLASKMVKEQTEEVNQMKKWREQYFPNVQSEEERLERVDLNKLQESKGKEFDSQFTKMMIKHHEDGIKLSKEVSAKLENEKIKSFAEKSISKQNEELKKLNELSKKIEKKS